MPEKNMYLNQIMLRLRHNNMVFLLFQFFPGRYTILSNNVKSIENDGPVYLVPIVRKERHKKFNHSSILRRKINSVSTFANIKQIIKKAFFRYIVRLNLFQEK